ncbi:bifunctional dihydroorotate dehydrogenase B NAD binding subunit/NADPH-dependent glutamate synthase [Anaerosphaera multitolerans]|uniref:Bifunctional dihydroorotate dehydrogenase B NAD binding subunit/NADPH-dependent glutamate synthase n=1 Tax=Anaerosphaera multitolerans TaxID=2487351 RepID=A0A437S8D1_9FIRM|nr:bifunctional dihydroorotate dehydrogenase B NAD binding subunit/NADPH-dependent glutamate synthase [Anaerosphaera multitolerans]RVU55356.1 bifunctional dihydroorotate dehydrogenase B NAD binding subunit/NADPH-dependent glutamate synthase [Anaerosphaera multitolerans]
MYKILKKEILAPNIYLFDVEAPRIAASAKPGQFVIVIADKYAERIPLTICGFDLRKGSVQIVVQASGKSTEKICAFEEGESFKDFVGPLGRPSEFISHDITQLRNSKFLFVAGGVGTAPVTPQVRWLYDRGIDVDVIIGAKSKDYVILEDKIRKYAKNVYIATDDGSYGFKGLVTDKIVDLLTNEKKHYDQCVAIGPMIMMKFVCQTTKKYNLPTTVSLNPIMVDGTGMCGACRVNVGNQVKFACVDGPEFDGHLVDFDSAIQRQKQFRENANNKRAVMASHKEGHICNLDEAIIKQHKDIELEEKLIRDELLEDLTFTEKQNRFIRTPMSVQDPITRSQNFEEVSLGYTEEEAIREAKRCLNCKIPHCIEGCPVSIDIPGFIKEIANGNFEQAAKVLALYTALPAVCGRVCPQETQCEEKCILGKKGDAIAIGKLERFVADYARRHNIKTSEVPEQNGHTVAVVGAGPAGLTCAGELAKMGYKVKIFEALQQAGGVLVYGIPEFRLPDSVVNAEVKNLLNLGVEIETDVVVGKTINIDTLLNSGYEAVFIGSGAGLPTFMNIPGEHLNGVISANEFLTRNNLMRSFEQQYDTPINLGSKVAIIGGGNVAMDAARVAKRLGADVSILYRRTEKELPARLEEVHHAKEEGIKFEMLTAPIEIKGEDGWVKSLVCVRNELGEPDESGRRRPVKIEGSEFEEPFETVIMALGTNPNPLISQTTSNLETNSDGCILTNELGQTSRKEIFAGGDAVTGSATVILAMGAGKTAAEEIDRYIRKKYN